MFTFLKNRKKNHKKKNENLNFKIPKIFSLFFLNFTGVNCINSINKYCQNFMKLFFKNSLILFKLIIFF